MEDAEEDYARLSCELKPEEKQTAKDLMEYREAFAFAKTIGMTLEDMVFQYIKEQELLASQRLSDINIALSTYVEWCQKNNINITLGRILLAKPAPLTSLINGTPFIFYADSME